MSTMNGNLNRSFLDKHSAQQHMDGGMFSTGFSHLFYENYSTSAGFNNGGGRMDRNPFITMIKTIVNGLILPVKAFEMSSNSLHRQKFTNSSMGMSNEMSFPCPEKGDRINDILELAVGPGSSSQSPILKPGGSLVAGKTMESAVIAIPTAESFPDLHLSPEKLPREAGTSGKCIPVAVTSCKMSCPRQNSQIDSNEDNFVILNHCSALKGPPCSFLRKRQISECSEDSFVICFTEDAPEGVIEVISDQSDLECATDEESDDDYDDEDEEEEDDEDEVDSSTLYPKKTENCFLITGESSQPDSGFGEDIPTKKVRFNLNPEVHLMCTWNFAYRAARKGHWEAYARDRDRFKRRVEGLEHILNPVLDSDHRERIYLTRFCDNTSLDQNEPFDKGTNCAKATN